MEFLSRTYEPNGRDWKLIVLKETIGRHLVNGEQSIYEQWVNSLY